MKGPSSPGGGVQVHGSVLHRPYSTADWFRWVLGKSCINVDAAVGQRPLASGQQLTRPWVLKDAYAEAGKQLPTSYARHLMLPVSGVQLLELAAL